MSAPRVRGAGFTLLPVVLAMSLVAAIAFLLNRDNVVNNNLIAGQADRERARYAAEAGLQAANYALQAAGCAGIYPILATPVTDANFGGASYSAYADLATGSPRTLTATGSYKGASVTLTRAGVYVYQSPMRTYINQPGPAAGTDTWIDSAAPAFNYGADTTLRINSPNQEALLNLDLTMFPAGSRIIPWYDGVAGALAPGARLEIYRSNATPPTASFIDANLITRSWTEGTGAANSGATWNKYNGTGNWPSPGVGYDARWIARAAFAAGIDWQTFDITSAAQAWMGTLTPNYGVWLRSSPAGVAINNARYISSDDTIASNIALRPRLRISYLLPCGAVAPVPPVVGVTVDLNPVADGYIEDGGNKNNTYGNLIAMYAFKSATIDNRALLRFDLSSIPSGTAIQSATLRVNSGAVTGATALQKTISAYALTRTWIEGSSNSPVNGATYQKSDALLNIDWTNAGGDYRTPAAAMASVEGTGQSPPPASFQAGWLNWNLKALTQEWVDGVTANNGVILISTVADKFDFATRERSGAGQKPVLTVTY